MQPDETRQPATRDDVTHSIEAQVAQECLALGPRSELPRAVQVTFRADLDDARSPGRGELPRALGGHRLVVAADHDRSLERQPLEGHGHEAMMSRLKFGPAGPARQTSCFRQTLHSPNAQRINADPVRDRAGRPLQALTTIIKVLLSKRRESC